jgi:uncharacterized membrane protein YfhO
MISLSFNNSEDYEGIIIADRYDKNWRLIVNDQKRELEDHNGMRWLPIDHGKNNIELRFVPVMWRWGLLITGLSITFALTLPRIVLGFRKRYEKN